MNALEIARSDYEAARARELSMLRVLASAAADHLRTRSDEHLKALAVAQERALAAGHATEEAWERYASITGAAVPFAPAGGR